MILRFQFHFLRLFFALIAGFSPDSRASDFLITNWRNEEGLPHSIINSVIQTQDGYLWIGTYVGLVRFDGVRFVHFNSGNMPELESGRVSKLFEDHDGTLWIALESGRLLALQNGVVRIHFLEDATSNHAVVAMVQDKSKTVWLQTSDGRLGRLTQTSVEFVAKTGSTFRSALALTLDDDDRLWVGTDEGLKLWRDGQLVISPGLEKLMGRPMEVVARAKDGSIWSFQNRMVRKIRAGEIISETEAPEQFKDVAVELLETFDRRLWLASSDGSLFYLEPSGVWKTVSDISLRGPNRTLFQDREGNIWRGSFGGGLSQLRPKLFTLHELAAPSLDRYAYSVSSDNGGNIWSLLNSRTLARVEAGSQTPKVFPGLPFPRSIRTLFVDRQNSLWAGSDSGYLYRLRNNEFVSELRVDDKAELISAIFEDTETNLWLGFTQGAGVGVLPQGDPRKFHIVPNMPYPDVRAITQGADGAMWFGTHYGGLFRLKDGKWNQFTTRDGLPSDYVRCLYSDPDGTVWIGTLRGLCRWHDSKFTTINAEAGLWSDSLSHITEDAGGNLWMSSFGGVFHVARTELNDFAEGRRTSVQCVGYNRNDGLPSQECPGGFQPAGAKTPDGRLWFPTADGLVSIDPKEIVENKLPPPVWVEEITIDGALENVRNVSSPLEIAPGQRRFEFRFTALSLSAPEKVRFRHKLEGLDPDWSRADNQRAVAYSYIPPGRYTFRVMACNNDGVWNTTGNSIRLVVQPFFWQTWWFKIGTALLLAAILIFSVRRVERWKAHLRLERLEQQHAVERERSRIAKDIHDDIGANLTQIVFLSQRVEGADNNPTEIARWLRLIPATAQRTIQSLDEIVWAINPKHDSLESLANYLSQFAQEHLSLASIRCVLEVPTVLPAAVLSAEVRHNLLLAVREALQNVVTHARASEVHVTLHLTENDLQISIADDGCGFDPTRQHGDGNGLLNIRRRLQDIGGTFEIASQPGRGTTVRLSVPQKLLHGRVIAGTNHLT